MYNRSLPALHYVWVVNIKALMNSVQTEHIKITLQKATVLFTVTPDTRVRLHHGLRKVLQRIKTLRFVRVLPSLFAAAKNKYKCAHLPRVSVTPSPFITQPEHTLLLVPQLEHNWIKYGK